MTDDAQTGPWVLALGTLAVGAVAMVRLLRRSERPDEADDAPPQS